MMARNNKKDPRTKATASVWGIACGMMGISIPLIAISGGAHGIAYLPVLAAVGAAVSSVAIWLSPRRDAAPPQIEGELEDIKDGLLALHDYVKSLEQKLETQELRLRIAEAETKKLRADDSASEGA
jgi:hypothetical protein